MTKTSRLVTARYELSSGANNLALGVGAGYNNISGSNNIFIGNGAGANETGSNFLYIDNSNTSTPLIKGDFENDTLTVNGSMTVTGALTADVINDTSGNRFIRRDANTGAIHIGQNSMVFDDASGAVGNGRDIMSSSVGQIQIGKNSQIRLRLSVMSMCQTQPRMRALQTGVMWIVLH